MRRSISYASSGASSRGSPRSVAEQFRVCTPTLRASSESRLQQQRRLSLRDSNAVISTALSPNGWLATATLTNVRLYDLEGQEGSEEVKRFREFPIRLKSRNEKIRAVAISEDLLAVVTHYRLIVYEYRETGGPEKNVLEDLRIDQNEAWTPKSVSIIQIDAIGTRQSPASWVAVGGEGVIGAKIFEFSHVSCWNSNRDHRLFLRCPQNTSSIRSVGFSQFLHPNKFIVFGVTSDNRIFCWDVHLRECASPVAVAGWELDSSFNENALSLRAEIASVSIFESPSGRPYIFCAVAQKHGAEQLRSFMAPLEDSRNDMGTLDVQWSALPESVASRNVLSGAVSPNGQFIVLVEEGTMRLVTLCGAYEGGLTCLEQTVDWRSSLRGAAKDISGISLSITENQGRLQIIAVDGRGHLVFARVNVPNMTVTEPLTFIRRPSAVLVELPADTGAQELYGNDSEDSIRADSMFGMEGARSTRDIYMGDVKYPLGADTNFGTGSRWRPEGVAISDEGYPEDVKYPLDEDANFGTGTRRQRLQGSANNQIETYPVDIKYPLDIDTSFGAGSRREGRRGAISSPSEPYPKDIKYPLDDDANFGTGSKWERRLGNSDYLRDSYPEDIKYPLDVDSRFGTGTSWQSKAGVDVSMESYPEDLKYPLEVDARFGTEWDRVENEIRLYLR